VVDDGDNALTLPSHTTMTYPRYPFLTFLYLHPRKK